MLDAYLQHNKPYLTFYILKYVYALVVNLLMNSKSKYFIGDDISTLPMREQQQQQQPLCTMCKCNP